MIEVWRMGDVRLEFEIIGNMMKLIGNLGYGFLIMDKIKYWDIIYV